MSWEFMVAAAIATLVVGAAAIVASKKASSAPPPDLYTLHPSLFSPAERSFLGVLDQAVGKEYRVFGKVRVSDVAEPKRGLPPKVRQSALNRIQSKHLDFVLCDPGTLEIKCAIELDDSSHAKAARRERDSFVASVCERIGVPLVRIPAKHSYSVAEIRQLLAASSSAIDQPNATTSASTVAAEAPRCPRCGAGMVARTAGSGESQGKPFWGCSTFPKCRAVVERMALDG